MHYSEKGLVHKIDKKLRCDRCDFPLKDSTWNNILVVFSTNRRTKQGFLCVSCMKHTRGSNKSRVTIQELDDFTRKLIKYPVKTIQKVINS